MNSTTANAAIPPPRVSRPLPVSETSPSYSLRHRHRPWVLHQKLVITSFLGDAMVVSLSLMAAYLVRFETVLSGIGVADPSITLQSYLGHVVLGSVFLLVLLGNLRMHDPRNFLAFRRLAKLIGKSCLVWLAGYLGLTLILKIEPPVSRIYCLLAATIAFVLLTGWRWVLHHVYRRESIARGLRQKVLFIGWNSECLRAVQRFQDGRGDQFEVLGTVAPPSGVFSEAPPAGVRQIKNGGPLRSVLRDSGADIVMAVDGDVDRASLVELADICGREFIDFKLVPSCFQILISGLELQSIKGLPVLGIGKLPLHHAFNNAAKRMLDIIGGIAGLVLSAPVMAVFVVLVYLESPGAVLYRQRRIGIDGRPFYILKIRSMKLDAESAGKPGWTVQDDPRRLRIGAFMRKWNIDELPQFWNVVTGDMSLVGPRPERPELIEDFKEEIPHYNVRHSIKPGLTGWAQVNGLRGDTCLRERVKFDLDYIEHWNFLLDLKIMALTLMTRKGAC
jgi:exopolysaccharide biosynthesis polyprenyl glycosylphosphotransferase